MVSFQASLELWEKVCRTKIGAVRWLRQDFNPNSDQVGGNNESDVDWSVVMVELPPIGNLQSFPFDGSVQSRKDFFVGNGVDGSSQT